MSTATFRYIRSKGGLVKDTDKLLTSDDVGEAAFYGAGENEGSVIPVGGFGIGRNSGKYGMYVGSRTLSAFTSSTGTEYLLLGKWEDSDFVIAGTFTGRRGASLDSGNRISQLRVLSAKGTGSRQVAFDYLQAQSGDGNEARPVK